MPPVPSHEEWESLRAELSRIPDSAATGDKLLEIIALLKKVDRAGTHTLEIFSAIVKHAVDTGQPTIEVPASVAQEVVVSLAPGRKGRPPNKLDHYARVVAILLARFRKAVLIDAGMTAPNAALQAAEEASERLQECGVLLGVSTIERRMQNAPTINR